MIHAKGYSRFNVGLFRALHFNFRFDSCSLLVAICLIMIVLQSNCNLYSTQDNIRSSYDKVKSCINDSVDENDAANISSRRQ